MLWRWLCFYALMVSVLVHGLEGTPQFDEETSWYYAGAPIQHDPVMDVIGELTRAIKPDSATVVRAVYEAAGEKVPSIASFKKSDLGESSGNKGGGDEDSMDGLLRGLLAEASSESASHWITSYSKLDSILQLPGHKKPNLEKASRAIPDGSKELDLDHSEPFIKDVLIQLELSPPTTAAVQKTLKHLHQEQRHLKRVSHEDMDLAEITENGADLRKGVAEVQKLEHVDHELKLAQRRARELEQLKEGSEPARAVLERSELEHRVEDRIWKEHLRRLQIHAKNTQKAAYDATMHSAKVADREEKHKATSSEHAKADAVASIAVDKSKAAAEALEAALGENKELEAFSNDEQVSGANAATPTLQIDKKDAQKLASATAVHAKHALENALMTDSGFGKAAKAAKVALAYEQTADEVGKGKLQHATTEVKSATQEANHAMTEAIQTSTHDSYTSLRTKMAKLQNARDGVWDLHMQQKMKSRLMKVQGINEEPSVVVVQRMAEDADAKFYKNIKHAERAYQDAETSAKDSDIDAVGTLVDRTEKAAVQSDKARLQLVKLRTTVAAKHTVARQQDAEAAIEAEHEGMRDYQRARRHAWNAITAKEGMETSSEQAHEKLSAAQEKLANEEASMLQNQDRYKRLEHDKKEAHRHSVAANAVYESSKQTLKRREATLKKLRKEASKDVGQELRRLHVEMETLEKSGHMKEAQEALEQNSDVRKDRQFLKDEETREMNDKVELVKKESTRDLAAEMDKLVVDEKDKLQREVAASGKDTKPDFEAHSGELDKRLAELSARTSLVVRQKIEALATKTPSESIMKRSSQAGQDELGPMFRTVSQIQKANNEQEKNRRDKVYTKRKASLSGPVEKLKQMQSVADKPLVVAEAELQKVIRVEKEENDSYATNTFDGYKEAHGQGSIDKKFTNAQRALKLAKQSMDGASTTIALKRSQAKMQAAKKLINKAKLAKIQQERQALEQKMDNVNRDMASKRSSLQQAADAAAEALRTLQQGALEKAKTKILEAQIRHDRSQLQNMEEQIRERRETADHERHNYNDIGGRADNAHFSYTKAQRLVQFEKQHMIKLRERADDAQRHYDTAIKVAHLGDERYKEAGQEVKELKNEAKRKEQRLKAARKDLKGEMQAEQQAIMAQASDRKP